MTTSAPHETFTIKLNALLIIIFAAAAMRLLPHPPNVSPIAAMALFGGVYFSSRWLALFVPLAAMALSDLALGLFVYDGFSLGSRPYVYGSFAAVVGLGLLVRRASRFYLAVGGAALTGSVLFFLVTNFGVWWRSSFYPASLEGLLACYTAALPFFRNSLTGDAFYAFLLFGSLALAQRWYPTWLHASRPHA